MLSRVFGAALDGVDGVVVSVEVEAGRGLPSFQIVGQGDRVVNESRDRIRAAFRQSGLEFPPGRVTVNLAPTWLPKAGAALDLPIAVGVAAARLELPAERLARTLFLGELGLDGGLRAVRGALALAACARHARLGTAVVPEPSLAEAAVCPGIEVRGAETLAQVIEFARDGGELLRARIGSDAGPPLPAAEPDLADLRGQLEARRALEVAAAGGHNLLLVGPPGAGKTLLARRLAGVLPDLAFEHALEATRIHGVVGALGGRALLARPPFRAPHHTISDVAMLGGGRPLRPGEISLAHRGVLFLDELPEFRRSVLEALRQPLEEGEIRIARAHGAARLPARVQLVAAMNPCACGWWGDAERACRCDDPSLRRYRTKLSGPLLDRIDLCAHMPRSDWGEVARGGSPEPSAPVRSRVERARQRQAARARAVGVASNAELPEPALRRAAGIGDAAWRRVEHAAQRLQLSMRACVRVLRVARSIADLDDSDEVRADHASQAVALRSSVEGRDAAAPLP